MTGSRDLKGEIENFLDGRAEEIVALSDRLGKNPEVSGKEFESSRILAETLAKGGFEVELPFMGIETAFMAKKKCGPGGVVALLAEYDALPGIGHGCGHNLHGTLSVYAGLALARAVEKTGGEVWVVGTPAEETDGAKVPMAREGVFDGADLAMMFHSNAGKSYVDMRVLAIEAFEFVFKGRTAHSAAAPWDGVSALNALRLFLNAVDMLRLHLRPTSRVHAVVSEGGTAPNIIPDRAACFVEARSPRLEGADELFGFIFDCARGAATATRTSVEWRQAAQPFVDLRPNLPAEELAREMLEAYGFTCVPGPGAEGSSDVGNISARCPVIHPMVDITGRPVTIHTHEFAQATFAPEAHDALLRGSKALASIGLAVLTDPALRDRIRAAFTENRDRY